MFLGSFKTYFSGRNRLILPKRFRKELDNKDRFFIILGFDGEIWGFDSKNWQKQAEIILNFPLSTVEGREKRRIFFSRAEECVLDAQGRFILPQEFIEQVNFEKEVWIIGAGDHFEIWSSKDGKKILLGKQDEPSKSLF